MPKTASLISISLMICKYEFFKSDETGKVFLHQNNEISFFAGAKSNLKIVFYRANCEESNTKKNRITLS
jgi:hypothetical protein